MLIYLSSHSCFHSLLESTVFEQIILEYVRTYLEWITCYKCSWIHRVNKSQGVQFLLQELYPSPPSCHRLRFWYKSQMCPRFVINQPPNQFQYNHCHKKLNSMVEQLLFLEQYYRHLIMENLERVDLVVRDLCKLKKSVFHEILVKILFL